MKTSKAGLDLIKKFEGFRAKPYLCSAGVPTIGYGTTVYPNGIKVKLSDQKITQQLAESFLQNHVNVIEKEVSSLVKVPLKQNQFDALVSFAYNVGSDIDEDTKAEGLGDSTLLKLLNAGDIVGASKQFELWNKAGGKVSNGLIGRRKAEKTLFFGLGLKILSQLSRTRLVSSLRRLSPFPLIITPPLLLTLPT